MSGPPGGAAPPMWAQVRQEATRTVAQWRAYCTEHGLALPDASGPPPIRISCDLDGVVVQVVFAEGAREHMSVADLSAALHAAAQLPLVVRPDGPLTVRLDAALAWSRRLRAQDDAAGAVAGGVVHPIGRHGVSADGKVEVAYEGTQLRDVRLRDRAWATFASARDIEADVMQASRAALGPSGDSTMGG